MTLLVNSCNLIDFMALLLAVNIWFGLEKTSLLDRVIFKKNQLILGLVWFVYTEQLIY